MIVVDDFADDPICSRHSQILRSCSVRGRHNIISTVTTIQKFNSVAPIIRINTTELYVYRLRNMTDLDTFIDEVSAVLD